MKGLLSALLALVLFAAPVSATPEAELLREIQETKLAAKNHKERIILLIRTFNDQECDAVATATTENGFFVGAATLIILQALEKVEAFAAEAETGLKLAPVKVQPAKKEECETNQ